jgi:GNAT superfamily N-acetyltransferase
MRIDLELVRRVEHSGAELALRQVDALARRAPTSGAAGVQLDGGALISFGHGRYVNRAMGLGLGGTPPDEIVSALGEFFTSRGLTPSLELCPLADAALLPTLATAGYRLERFRNVYARTLHDLPRAPTVPIVSLSPGATLRHAILAGDAPPDSEARRISDEYCDAAGYVDGAFDLVALVDGEPAACGSLNVIDRVGWLGGAATLPERRGRGLQQQLVEQRLILAADEGCDVAAATAVPDGQSASNLRRFGFDLLYTQVVLTRQ